MAPREGVELSLDFIALGLERGAATCDRVAWGIDRRGRGRGETHVRGGLRAERDWLGCGLDEVGSRGRLSGARPRQGGPVPHRVLDSQASRRCRGSARASQRRRRESRVTRSSRGPRIATSRVPPLVPEANRPSRAPCESFSIVAPLSRDTHLDTDGRKECDGNLVAVRTVGRERLSSSNSTNCLW